MTSVKLINHSSSTADWNYYAFLHSKVYMDGFQLEHHLSQVDTVLSHLWDCIYWPVMYGFTNRNGANGPYEGTSLHTAYYH